LTGSRALTRPKLPAHITAYLPGKDRSVGSAIVIFPGGGYMIEAWKLEATTVVSSGRRYFTRKAASRGPGRFRA
jgi:hypothetical protein